MKTIILIAAAALGAGWPQNADLRLSEIKAQHPKETIFASALCQRAGEAQQGWIYQSRAIDPQTFVPDLNTLMEKSDEVILGDFYSSVTVLSPSGKTPATYLEGRVIHSWKGPHHSGDTLTFGWPFGNLYCDEGRTSWFDVEPDEDFGVADPDGGNYFFDYVFVMFLRQPKGEETQMVQGLLPAAGEGLQGWFWIRSIRRDPV